MDCRKLDPQKAKPRMGVGDCTDRRPPSALLPAGADLSPQCVASELVRAVLHVWASLLRGMASLESSLKCVLFSAWGGGCRKGSWRSVHTCQLLESGFHFDVFLHLRVIGMEIHQLGQID